MQEHTHLRSVGSSLPSARLLGKATFHSFILGLLGTEFHPGWRLPMLAVPPPHLQRRPCLLLLGPPTGVCWKERSCGSREVPARQSLSPGGCGSSATGHCWPTTWAVMGSAAKRWVVGVPAARQGGGPGLQTRGHTWTLSGLPVHPPPHSPPGQGQCSCFSLPGPQALCKDMGLVWTSMSPSSRGG